LCRAVSGRDIKKIISKESFVRKSSTNATYFASENDYNKQEQIDAQMLFDNLIWLTTEEAARYIRKSTNALRIAVHKGHINARKFRRRLYFRKNELDLLLDNSFASRR
jgi:excisionase family DNA binding protein